MSEFMFRVWFAEEQEHFAYSEYESVASPVRPAVRHFPLMESFLSFFYLEDTQRDEIFRAMAGALKQYEDERDPSLLDTVRDQLDLLAQRHIFYQVLRLDWRHRIEQTLALPDDTGAWNRLGGALELMPTALDYMHEQTRELFEQVLGIGGDRRPIPEKVAVFYERKQIGGLGGTDYFRFDPLSLTCELVSSSVFTEVLYANRIDDLFNYYLRACILHEHPARRCKNCGRWFILTGHQGLEYCDRPFDEKGHTCRDVGAGLTWERKSREDKPFMAYRKEYKKRFARIKAGRITNDEFLAWGERARAKKQECDAGAISLEEFREWLENS